MTVLSKLKIFAKNDSGAVTVDWVVLTAGILGLSTLMMMTIASSTVGLAEEINTTVDATEVGYEG